MGKFIQRTKALGDVVMVEPILDFLMHQDEKVTFITSEPCFDLFEGLHSNNIKVTSKKPYIKQIYRKAFYKIHRLNYERFPHLPVQEAYAKILNLEGFKPRRPKFKAIPTPISDKLKYPYALIHTETASDLNYRQINGVQWDHVKHFLYDHNLGVYKIAHNCLFDGEGKLIGELRIKDLKAIIKGCELFIGNDSFPSHLAVAFHRPSIIFFGAVNPHLRHPDLDNVIIMQNECEFSGCYHNPEFFSIKGKSGSTICQIVGNEGNPPCTVHSSEKVISSINTLLKKSGI